MYDLAGLDTRDGEKGSKFIGYHLRSQTQDDVVYMGRSKRCFGRAQLPAAQVEVNKRAEQLAKQRLQVLPNHTACGDTGIPMDFCHFGNNVVTAIDVDGIL